MSMAEDGPRRCAVSWRRLFSDISGWSCFGYSSRESGHRREPLPPDKITGKSRTDFSKKESPVNPKTSLFAFPARIHFVAQRTVQEAFQHGVDGRSVVQHLIYGGAYGHVDAQLGGEGD